MTRAPVLKIPRISDGEEALWTQMRTQLPSDVPRPQREYPFDPNAAGRKWRFDFAWPDERIAVEVEGGTWSQGRHTRGAGYEADLDKYNTAALRGWLVLRVTTEMIVDNGRSIEKAMGLILEALTHRFSLACQNCRRGYYPLLYTGERERHALMANGLSRCQGHARDCSPRCTSDHA